VFWRDIQRGFGIQAVYVVVFLAAAWANFSTKDITALPPAGQARGRAEGPVAWIRLGLVAAEHIARQATWRTNSSRATRC
jgi:hypothetical protein